MKNLKITAAVMAALMGVSGLAAAQPYGDRHDDRRDGRPPMSHRGPPPQRHGPPPMAMHHDGRGAGPDHAFYRGGRLPPEYRNRSYVVNDWRNHHLSAPPRGYQWVQTGGDYVLAAVATGIIASIILNN